MQCDDEIAHAVRILWSDDPAATLNVYRHEHPDQEYKAVCKVIAILRRACAQLVFVERDGTPL